jgi:hypothetical protein
VLVHGQQGEHVALRKLLVLLLLLLLLQDGADVCASGRVSVPALERLSKLVPRRKR